MKILSDITLFLLLGISSIKCDVRAAPGQKLSEFLIDTGKDIYDKLLNIALVQEVLMNGKVNDQSRAIAQRFYTSASDIWPKWRKVIGPVVDQLNFDDEEKKHLKGYINGYDISKQPYTQWAQEMNTTFGDDVDQLDVPNKLDARIVELFDVANSEIQILTANLPRFFVLSGLRNYLDSKGKYKDNKVAKLLLLDAFDKKDKLLSEGRKYIDRRLKSVSDEDKKKLTDIYRKSMKDQVDWHLSVLTGHKYN